jgi:hypothetical protein
VINLVCIGAIIIRFYVCFFVVLAVHAASVCVCVCVCVCVRARACARSLASVDSVSAVQVVTEQTLG